MGCPLRSTRIVTGVAAWQPLTGFPAHLWEEILRETSSTDSPRLPSTATILSPGFRYEDAGGRSVPFAIVCVGTGLARSPCAQKIAVKITKAIRRFIPGPARITTTRFQTGWL